MTIQCSVCQRDIDIPITDEQYIEWVSSGSLVQRAFPQLTDDQREILISGICGPCFDALFEEEL